MVVTRPCGSPISPLSASRNPIGRNRISAAGKTRKTTRKQTQASLEKSPPLKKARVQLIDKHVGELVTLFLSFTLAFSGKKQSIYKNDSIIGYSPFNPVALDGEQLAIWRKFLATDEKVMRKLVKMFIQMLGIVTSLAEFAIDTFNKSYKLHVDANTDAAMALTKCVGCYYYKLTDYYYFYVKLEATEIEEPRVYEVVVRCECADGSRTLTKFCFDREEFDKTVSALFPPEPDTEEDVPSTEFDTEEDVPSTESDTEEDVPRNRKEFYKASGMVLRRFIYGHDFYNPLSKDMFICFDGGKPKKIM